MARTALKTFEARAKSWCWSPTRKRSAARRLAGRSIPTRRAELLKYAQGELWLKSDNRCARRPKATC